MVSGRSGLVLEREGGTFRVSTEAGEVMAVLRGKAKRSRYDRVVVGDRVTLDEGDAQGTLGISGVEPRRNLLERRTPSGRSNRPVAANLDRVYVVTSAADPQPIPQLIDRLCAIAEANEIPVALVVNKSELGSADTLAARYRHAGQQGRRDRPGPAARGSPRWPRPQEHDMNATTHPVHHGHHHGHHLGHGWAPTAVIGTIAATAVGLLLTATMTARDDATDHGAGGSTTVVQ